MASRKKSTNTCSTAEDEKENEEQTDCDEENAENEFSMGAIVQVVILFYQV